jgi:hypothetical protein
MKPCPIGHADLFLIVSDGAGVCENDFERAAAGRRLPDRRRRSVRRLGCRCEDGHLGCEDLAHVARGRFEQGLT